VLGQARAVQRHTPRVREDEEPLTGRIVELSAVYGRYGSPRITAMLKQEGWTVNHKRVERIWREAGLKVPQKQPKRGRLWLNDGSCIRLRPQHQDHVWAYDFVSAPRRRSLRVRPPLRYGRTRSEKSCRHYHRGWYDSWGKVSQGRNRIVSGAWKPLRKLAAAAA
jgi:hypothetical protein